MHGGAPRLLPRVGRALSVRAHILFIVLAAVLPLLLLAAFLAYAYAVAETERFERRVRELVFDAALAIERDLTATAATLQALAVSRALATGDFAAFHAQAIAVREVLDSTIVLRDASGRQILSTRAPLGSRLPETSSSLRWDPEIQAGSGPFVTGHYRGIINPVSSYAVVVPVRHDGVVTYMLHVSYPTSRLRDLLAPIQVPAGTVFGVLDRDHVVLARSQDHEAAAGTPSTATPLLRTMTGEERHGRYVSRDGQDVFLVLRRIGSSGWVLAAGAPVETILAPLRQTLLAAAAVILGLAALAIGGALYFGGRVARAICRLAGLGAALDGGAPLTPPNTPVSEVNEVAGALATAAARHGLMVHELNHRVRNTLATVDSIVRLGARHAASIPEYQARLSDRIRSLGKTHVLLTASHWTEASLEELLRTEFAAHDAAGAGRVTLTGPPVALPARHAVAFGMLAHELATNAAKYGALSAPEGCIEVRWTLREPSAGAAPVLHLTWTESGGPAVTPPTRQGFGTRLIERAIARDLGAKVEADYAPGGLRFTLVMPLAAPPRGATLDQAAALPRLPIGTVAEVSG